MNANSTPTVALPDIQTSLGAGVSGVQWTIDAYPLSFAALMLLAGSVADLFDAIGVVWPRVAGTVALHLIRQRDFVAAGTEPGVGAKPPGNANQMERSAA